ncbi:MAG: LytTR family DNA-binding domain-containing protein [Bacteroidota bacterium]|nr:LytTR family DNA-binding domain-containing protein [Bacteroidota bacterium]
MKIVIIEDEQFTAEDLASTVMELRSNYQVVKILSSIKEAKVYFSKHADFNLIFSDIHLGDGLSFEIFKSIPIKVPVIFCTAYDNYAIDAFKANGIDYVLKPINKKSISEAIEKFERLSTPVLEINPGMAELLELFQSKSPENKNNTSILVHVKDKIIPIKTEDIAVFFIRNEGTSILDFTGKIYSIDETLEEIELLNSTTFFRANRQFIVNRKAVKDAAQHFSRKLILNLSIPFSEQITISKEKTPQFLKWLKNT